jgi:hypothetical protein
MSRIQLFILSAIFFVNGVFPGQQHRAGTSGPETPALQGQGRFDAGSRATASTIVEWACAGKCHILIKVEIGTIRAL